MGAFRTEKSIHTRLTRFDGVVHDIEQHFTQLGYEVDKVRTDVGMWDISIAKGGKFKAVAGLKTALKILLQPEAFGLSVYAGVGIFGKQAAPALLGAGAIRAAALAGGAVVSVVALPLLVTQVWGLVKQAKLDNEAIVVIEQSIRRHEHLDQVQPVPRVEAPTVAPRVADNACPGCRASTVPGAAFCNSCGTAIA